MLCLRGQPYHQTTVGVLLIRFKRFCFYNFLHEATQVSLRLRNVVVMENMVKEKVKGQFSPKTKIPIFTLTYSVIHPSTLFCCEYWRYQLRRYLPSLQYNETERKFACGAHSNLIPGQFSCKYQTNNVPCCVVNWTKRPKLKGQTSLGWREGRYLYRD